jgi:hypothetical protein
MESCRALNDLAIASGRWPTVQVAMVPAGASNPKISGINVHNHINVSDFSNISWAAPNRDAFVRISP